MYTAYISPTCTFSLYKQSNIVQKDWLISDESLIIIFLVCAVRFTVEWTKDAIAPTVTFTPKMLNPEIQFITTPGEGKMEGRVDIQVICDRWANFFTCGVGHRSRSGWGDDVRDSLSSRLLIGQSTACDVDGTGSVLLLWDAGYLSMYLYSDFSDKYSQALPTHAWWPGQRGKSQLSSNS